MSKASGATRARWISTEGFWKWIDAHGRSLGSGDRISMRSAASGPDRRQGICLSRGTKVQQAGSDMKKPKRLAVQDDRSSSETQENCKIVEGENDLSRFKARPRHMAMTERVS
jgi:hypothetical protein